MAAPELSFTPVDEATGISYLVYATPEDYTQHTARQHHQEHPSTRPELQDYTGQVLRLSRTEELPDHLHMGIFPGSYHDKLWGPEKIPTDSNGKMTKAFLNLAHVIPRHAIVMSPDGFTTKELTDEEHAFLSHPQLTHIEGRTPKQRQYKQATIGASIVRYAIAEQPITEIVSPKVANEYQRTLDDFRERELGNYMIQAAVNESLSPALELYEAAKAEGMVDPRYLGLRAVIRSYLNKALYGNYYVLLHQKLSAEQNHEPIPLQTGVDNVELAA